MVDLSSDPAVATPYLESEADLDDIKVSPDGTLAAYPSDETGREEVYVRSFPDPRQPETVSQGGGELPFWSPDGNTLYYWGRGDAGQGFDLMAARIERGPPFVVTSREKVLTSNFLNGSADLHPDGDRLIGTVRAGTPSATSGEVAEPERFLVVVNWFEELKERMGGR
jgi:Tol biopolymer transport system component